jgi:hypothetical protein
LKLSCLLILIPFYFYPRLDFHHFHAIGGEEDPRYEEHLPRARKFVPTRGQTRASSIRKTLDRLLPHDMDWACYEDRRQICPLQPISLYFGQIRCGPINVWYLPERVLRQFGYVQTIPSLHITPLVLARHHNR